MIESIKTSDQQSNSTILRLIRCGKTRRYFKDGSWTEDSHQATTFTDEMDAVRACIENGLNNVELVLRAPGTGNEIFATPIR